MRTGFTPFSLSGSFEAGKLLSTWLRRKAHRMNSAGLCLREANAYAPSLKQSGRLLALLF